MKKIHHCKSCSSENLKTIAKQKSFGFEYNIVQCQNCNLRFRDIELNNAEIAQLYGQQYFDDEQHDYFFDHADLKSQIFARRFETIKKYHPNKGTILDLGSAVGLFLEVAQKNNWQTTGLEVSEFASNIARQKGLNSITGDFSKLNGFNQLFDVITLWDVVDHAEYPLELLNNVRKKTRKGGHIWVETTVVDSSMFEIAEQIFRLSGKTVSQFFLKGYPVHHSNYYTSHTMAADIERAGFKVKEIQREAFGSQLFSGSRIGKMMFSGIEKISEWQKKQIVCTIIAEAV